MNVTVIEARNPKWENAEHTSIQIECRFSHYPDEWLPFRAIPTDSEAHGRDIFVRAAAGEFGSVAPYVAPPPAVPKVVTMRQARLALLQAGLLSQVDAAVQQAGPAAQIEWEYATELRRTHTLTQDLAQGLGLTEAQLDALFTQASSL